MQISVLVAIISCKTLEGRSGRGFLGNIVCPRVSRELRRPMKIQKHMLTQVKACGSCRNWRAMPWSTLWDSQGKMVAPSGRAMSSKPIRLIFLNRAAPTERQLITPGAAGIRSGKISSLLGNEPWTPEKACNEPGLGCLNGRSL